uniref:Ig-like domain-containing protein n=1 Tax=Pelodiscus sinensis TaxID=13735 RepID=K7G1F1_PELSI
MGILLWTYLPPHLLIYCFPRVSILELSGTYDIKGTWKSSITLPCVYTPSQDIVQQTVIWTLERDQSPATVFRRDSSGDHILLSQYRDRVSVPNSTPGDVSLEIEMLEVTDSGHYTCKVTWKAPNKSLLTKERTMMVRVIKVAVTKPIIKPGNLGFTVPKGASASLTCSANGSPPIIYRWFKGEPGGKAVHVSNHAVLMFDSLQMSDTGKYYCKAENRATSQVMEQSDSVQLTVMGSEQSIEGVEESATFVTFLNRPHKTSNYGTLLWVWGVPHSLRRSFDPEYQGASLPLYVIILIGVLCMAVVLVVIAVILCRR